LDRQIVYTLYIVSSLFIDSAIYRIPVNVEGTDQIHFSYILCRIAFISLENIRQCLRENDEEFRHSG